MAVPRCSATDLGHDKTFSSRTKIVDQYGHARFLWMRLAGHGPTLDSHFREFIEQTGQLRPFGIRVKRFAQQIGQVDLDYVPDYVVEAGVDGEGLGNLDEIFGKRRGVSKRVVHGAVESARKRSVSTSQRD